MKKILVIEDDFSYQKLLNDQLTKNGYEVILAINGKRGLNIAREKHPDLIILDIKMPGMDGITMLHEFREDAYGKSTNVIILTNFDPDDKILQTILVDLPYYYFIKSDIQLGELLEKIKDILLFDKKSE
jgi:DNA-binding response OmpR family regulator